MSRRKTPPQFYAFDLLWSNGEDLRDRPLLEHKEPCQGRDLGFNEGLLLRFEQARLHDTLRGLGAHHNGGGPVVGCRSPAPQGYKHAEQ